MQTVLVPGLFSCEMIDRDGVIIWPPNRTTRPIDTTTLVNSLTSRETVFGAVIDEVGFPCDIEAYGPIMTRLAGRGGFTAFAYDWRVDIRDAADALAATLDRLPAEDIVLVAHSMGGLVARWLLESGQFTGSRWFPRIRRLVAVATPHLGAPLALFRLLGQDPIVPFFLPSWATRLLASDPEHWPSGYQLLPPPGIDVVTLPNGTRRDVTETFADRLDPVGLRKMSEVQAVLDRFARPDTTSYVLAYGIGSAQTVTGVQLGADGGAHEVLGDGDGTVPAWSGEPSAMLAAAAPTFSDVAAVMADHVGILGNAAFLRRLDGWLSP